MTPTVMSTDVVDEDQPAAGPIGGCKNSVKPNQDCEFVEAIKPGQTNGVIGRGQNHLAYTTIKSVQVSQLSTDFHDI